MRATLIGATGLIGSHLLELLLHDDYFDTVRILVRRPFELIHPKLEKKLVDFSDKESFRLALEDSDVIFCAIGTTQKKVKGNKEAYRKVDYDISVNAAQLGKLCGCETFVLVSSVGANPKSNNFYLKLKGEIEEAVKAVGLKKVNIMQPSLLLGKRKESRFGEMIAQWIMPVASIFIPSKYKPVKAITVAKAMIQLVKEKQQGLFIAAYKEIKQKAN
jgi:uncharacterized protein YbjT (DUF2867 family)